MASANSDIIKISAPGASIVSTANILRIQDVVASGSRHELLGYAKIQKPGFLDRGGSVIARIPISEGCLSSCSFCETKTARGPLNSFNEDTILKAISMSVNSGAKEIELASQDAGAYGADTRTGIAGLASRASSIKGSFMVRIGMLNPEHLHRCIDDLICSFNDPASKLFRFLHLPVQSGSNKVLKDMKRRYTIEEFYSYVGELRRSVKGISIATDVIVGYPTETESDYLETRNMLMELKPTITNISKFSQRPHAAASRLAQLTANEVKRRSTELSRMVRAMQKAEYAKLMGKRISVLITERSGSSVSGRDISYRPVGMLNAGGAVPGETVWARAVNSSYACVIASAEPTAEAPDLASDAGLNTLPAIFQ
jgi:MiaB/RimO family radical SAM methylthiotransferase